VLSWSANVGWIDLGSNAPANGIQYQNNSATDCGVNQDGLGNLRGFAYGANIGWINFEANGAPKVDWVTGKLSGSVYSANCGWISLSNALAVVQTDHIQAGADIDGDGIADAWERTYTNTLTAFTATRDADHDGFSDQEEYLADTHPLDAGSQLRITEYSVGFVAGSDVDTLTWTSEPTRQYRVQHRTDVSTNAVWLTLQALFPPDPGATTAETIGFPPGSSRRFFRVQALRPLP